MDLQGGRKDGQHLARARRGHCLSRGNGRVASPPDPASTHGESFAAGDQTEGSIMKADWGAEILHPTCGKWDQMLVSPDSQPLAVPDPSARLPLLAVKQNGAFCGATIEPLL